MKDKTTPASEKTSAGIAASGDFFGRMCFSGTQKIKHLLPPKTAGKLNIWPDYLCLIYLIDYHLKQNTSMPTLISIKPVDEQKTSNAE